MLGQTLSHYEILEKLGEGGMGVVYKARDSTLNRLVALKVLPPEKLTNPDRKRRFLQEAQSASALNHPNIVTIHEISSDKNADFLVMEYIAGKTLDLLIAQKSLRPSDTLKYAIQIADALTAAHSSGIIHRDLKPSNIIVSDHGVAKVLDFGLAKLVEATASQEDETRTIRQAPAHQTAEGSIIGTAAYMSPEQAEGKPVDSRSDIFSFGALLYEMVTGVRAFQGESGMSTLGAVIHKEPKPVQELAPNAPTELAKLIQRCLRKDPERRFHHMVDIKVALTDFKEESESGASRPVPPPPNSRRWLSIGVPALLLATTAAGGLYWFRPSSVDKPMRIVPLTTYDGAEFYPTFSPDGSQVAFSWGGDEKSGLDIYVKLINSTGPPASAHHRSES